MSDTAEDLFGDETIAASKAVVDETIRRAGGARAAIRALLIDFEEARRAVSLGYRRGRQPAPRRT